MTVPGDRADSLIEQTARAALCGPDRIIVREDKDRRGRREGEVAQMLAAVLERERPSLPVHVVLDEVEALATAVRDMQPGELVVALYDDYDAVANWLGAQGATRVQEFRPFGMQHASVQPAA
jgi:cyanophycin synthetase